MDSKCPECGGAGIEFRGSGNNLESKVCSRWKEPGHPSKAEMQKKREGMILRHGPASGRFA